MVTADYGSTTLKDLEAIKYVNKLKDDEFVLILYYSVQHRTKDLLACLELPDVRGARQNGTGGTLRTA